MVSHGQKMNKMGAPHPQILPVVELTGLVELVGANYDTIDKGLLCTYKSYHNKLFHLLINKQLKHTL